MGYRDWAERHKDTVHATSAIFSCIGIFFSVCAVAISFASWQVTSDILEENVDATKADVAWKLQRFGVEMMREISDDAAFRDFLFLEGDSMDGGSLEIMHGKFTFLLSFYHMGYVQWTLGFIEDGDWILIRADMCEIMTTRGADAYFFRTPVEKLKLRKGFKKDITECRKQRGE